MKGKGEEEKRKAKGKMKKNVNGKKKRGEEAEEANGIFCLTEKDILFFLLEFLVVSALFLGVWYYIGEFYQSAVLFFARVILIGMGYTLLQITAVNISGAYLGNFNLVPLVALAIATPKLAVTVRLKMLAIGIPLLYLLHVVDLVAHFPLYFHGSILARVIVYSIGVGGVALPFVIWFFFCSKAVFSGLKRKADGSGESV